MSHHGESPLAQQYPQLDICDLFVFRGADGGTVIIQTLSPLSGPAGFHPDGQYTFHVDTDGDARANITFRLAFGPADPAGRQPLQAQLLEASAGMAPEAAGETLAAGLTENIVTGARGIRLWAGRAADPFYINPGVVGAVATAVQGGTPLDLRTLVHAQPSNLFAGHNVNAIVLEVPDSLLLASAGNRDGARPRGEDATSAEHGGRTGFWATTTLRNGSTWLRIQRCGLPLILTIFFDPSGEEASAYNAGEPEHDRETYGPLVSALSGRVAAALGATQGSLTHGTRVRDQLFPDILWYQPGTPAHFGFGQRNGRGLTDPVAEVMFTLVTGRAIPLGIDANSAAGSLRSSFPYLSAPVPEPTPAEA